MFQAAQLMRRKDLTCPNVLSQTSYSLDLCRNQAIDESCQSFIAEPCRQLAEKCLLERFEHRLVIDLATDAQKAQGEVAMSSGPNAYLRMILQTDRISGIASF